jgi:regulator of nonsense transcripts 2
LKADSSESIDEASIDYIPNFYNNKEAWIRLKRSLLRSSKTNYAILRYYARFILNISQIRKDFQLEICTALMNDFNDLSKEEVLNMNEERIKNIRFICEMIKLNAFPMQNVFEILKKLLDDFKGVSIDLLCNLMENAGRYLFLNEQSHLKFNSCLETIKLNTQYSKFIYFFKYY